MISSPETKRERAAQRFSATAHWWLCGMILDFEKPKKVRSTEDFSQDAAQFAQTALAFFRAA